MALRSPLIRHALLTSITLLSIVQTRAGHSAPHDGSDLIRLLEQGSCQHCKLQDADLVHADLSNMKLHGAQFQRANLSGAKLDGADLSATDLSHTSLAGASLRGANLQGSVLVGTDLRHSDLSGALLEPGSLKRSHWQGALGIPDSIHSYPELHNAGILSAQDGRQSEAERWFSLAIQRMPDAAISWVARGFSRAEQGKLDAAAEDLLHAGILYEVMGDSDQAKALRKASDLLIKPPSPTKRGNGIGSQLISGALAALQALAPLAAKAMMPMPF